MAPVQPAASVAATGLGIRYIGEHCYANSGAYTAANSSQTVLDFTTGSGYIVGKLVVTAPIKEAEASNGRVNAYVLNYNGQEVYTTKCESANEDQPATDKAPILIPPFTTVTLTVTSDASASEFMHTAQIIGRVYGADE